MSMGSCTFKNEQQLCHFFLMRNFVTISVFAQTFSVWFLCSSLSLAVFFCALTSSQRAEMGKRLDTWRCASRPCLTDHSFIWCFAPTLWSNIFPLIFPFCFFSLLFIQLHVCLSNSDFWISTHIPGLQWQVWWLSHAGHPNTSSTFDSLSRVKPHIWQPPGEFWGVSTMNSQRWRIETIDI